MAFPFLSHQTLLHDNSYPDIPVPYYHTAHIPNYIWLRVILKSFVFIQHIPAGQASVALTRIIVLGICRISYTFQSPFAYVTSCGIKHLPWIRHSWIIKVGILCWLLDLTSAHFLRDPQISLFSVSHIHHHHFLENLGQPKLEIWLA